MKLAGRSFLALVSVWVATSLVAAQTTPTPPARSLVERYTEPIQIFTNRPRDLHQTHVVLESGSPGVLQPGFQMMYSFAKAEAVRSFRESWKRDGDCAICLLGRSVGMGNRI